MKIIKLSQSKEYFEKLGISEEILEVLLNYVLGLEPKHKKFILKNLKKHTDKINENASKLLEDITYMDKLFPF